MESIVGGGGVKVGGGSALNPKGSTKEDPGFI